MAFCDEPLTIRLGEDFHGVYDYFNIAVSEYQCIGEHDVGDYCAFLNGPSPMPGQCVLLQTLQLMNNDVTLN